MVARTRYDLAMNSHPDGKDRKTLKNGVVVVEARWSSMFAAFVVDGLIVLAIAGAVFGVMAAAAGPYGDLSAAWIAALVAWPVGAFAYGLTTAHRRSIGQAIAGTRTVRIADGSVPGFWRAGWVMFGRTIGAPIVLLGALSGAMTDTGVAHMSIDVARTRAAQA